MTKTFLSLTAEQMTALQEYAATFADRKTRNDSKPKAQRVQMARDWKEALMGDWYRASAPPVLHALRNSLGPSWLQGFEFNSRVVVATEPVPAPVVETAAAPEISEFVARHNVAVDVAMAPAAVPAPSPTPSFWIASEEVERVVPAKALSIPPKCADGMAHHFNDSFGRDALLPNDHRATLVTGTDGDFTDVASRWMEAIAGERIRDLQVRYYRSGTATARQGFRLRTSDGAFLRRSDSKGEALAIHRHAWRQMLSLLMEGQSPERNSAAVFAWLHPEDRAAVFAHVVARSTRVEGEGGEMLLRTHRDPATGLPALRAVLSGSHSSVGFDDSALLPAIREVVNPLAPAAVRRNVMETTGWAALDAGTNGARATISWRNSEVGAAGLEWWAGCYITALDATVRFKGAHRTDTITETTPVAVASASGRSRRTHRLPTVGLSHAQRMAIASKRIREDVKKTTAAAHTLIAAWDAAMVSHPGGVKLVAGEGMVAEVLMDALAERSRWPISEGTAKVLREIFTTETRLERLPFGSAAYIAGAFAVAATKTQDAEEISRLQELAGDWVLHGWR